jgi:pyridoxamine 5'-phosphate oxidase-like protein
MPLADLSAAEIDFLRRNRSAAMITVGADGMAKAVRVGIAVIDGELWSSGTAARTRTRRLRRDPRCTLFVFEPGYLWLGLETTVDLLDGPDAADSNVRLFRAMQGRPEGPLSWFGGEYEEDRFRQLMVDEGRLVYQFRVERSYGMITPP